MKNLLMGDFSESQTDHKIDSLINEFFPKDKLFALFYTAMRRDIPDNNTRAEVITAIIDDPTFVEVGCGTNRICFRHNGLIVKIALDRRGIVDNTTEHRVSNDLPNHVAKSYESNYFINIAEYIEVMDSDTFTLHQGEIRNCLQEIAKTHIFDDIGWTLKNHCNWGRRQAVLTADEREYYGDYANDVYDILVLDCGYMYRIPTSNPDAIWTCPKCHRTMSWNLNYTKFECKGTDCRFTVNPIEVYEQMDKTEEKMLNEIQAGLDDYTIPDFADINSIISDIENILEGDD